MVRPNTSMSYFAHFSLEELAPGVYAAVGIPGGAAHSNAGIIDLGGRALLFDACHTPTASRDLFFALEGMVESPLAYVIISHGHMDHWGGARTFRDSAMMLATVQTRDLMEDAGQDLVDLKRKPGELQEINQQLEARLKNESDPRWRLTLERSVSSNRHLQKALSAMDAVLPDLTFEGQMNFYGSLRSVELHGEARGHTGSDAFLALPDEKIAFIGDLGFFDCQPFLAYGDPLTWKEWLRKLEASEYEVFVPGHGPVGGKVQLRMQREYIDVLENRVKKVVERGGSLKDALKIKLPAAYDDWLMGGMTRFERNVEALFHRISAGA